MRRRKLELLIKQSNKTKKVIAEELGISTQMLNAIIRGDRNPSLKLAKQMSNMFGETVDELFFNSDKTHNVSQN